MQTSLQEKWRLLDSAVVNHFMESMITRCKFSMQVKSANILYWCLFCFFWKSCSSYSFVIYHQFIYISAENNWCLYNYSIRQIQFAKFLPNILIDISFLLRSYVIYIISIFAKQTMNYVITTYRTFLWKAYTT